MMTRRLSETTTLAWPLAATMLLALGACGGGGNGPDTGQLSVAVTDAPIDMGITKVMIRFRGIELKPESGPPILFDFGEGNERDIDLLQLQGSGSAYLIVDETVPAGRYLWTRLLVDADKDAYDSYIEKHGSEMYPLYVPSGAKPGLKLVSDFVVPAGGSADFVIDWNLAQAIHQPTGQDLNHYLRPALKIVDRAESGVIRGTVDAALVDENAPGDCAGGNRVYLFAKPDAETPIDDLDMETDDARADVLTTASVDYRAEDNTWAWEFGFVAPGNYTIAFTCSAVADDPALDEYPDDPASAFGFASRADVEVPEAGADIAAAL
jgi:hypothetical protein